MNKQATQPAMTVKGIIEGVEKIHYVFHDEEGDWQFLPNRKVHSDEVSIVSLDQILTLDSTISDVLSMPLGNMAERVGLDKWQIKKM